MDPVTAFLAAWAAVASILTGRQKLKANRMVADTDMATLVDHRIQKELSRMDTEIMNLKERVRTLEGVEANYESAVLYMRIKGLPWPPPEVENV